MNTYIDIDKAEKIKDRILVTKAFLIDERENSTLKIGTKRDRWIDGLSGA